MGCGAIKMQGLNQIQEQAEFEGVVSAWRDNLCSKDVCKNGCKSPG